MAQQENINTSENWDAASSGYAEKVAPAMMESFSEELIKRLEVNSNSKVLEVGAGSGALTYFLAQKVDQLYATDFSPNMINILKRRMSDAGIDNVTCEVMDGQSLDLEDQSFDRAACMFALMLFPDRHKGFTELYRVLRPGGRAVVSGWAGPDKFEGFRLFLEGIQLAFPDFPKPQSPPPVFSLADPADFKNQMKAAGFLDVDVDMVAREMVIQDFEGLWEMLTTGAPPVKALFDRVGEQGKEKVKEALAGIVEQRYGRGPISLVNTATIGTGSVN